MAGIALVVIIGLGFVATRLLDKTPAAQTVRTPALAPALSAEERAKVAARSLGVSDLTVTNLSAQNAELGQLRVTDGLRLAPSLQPSSPVAGELYYDQTTNQMAYYNGTQFVSLGNGAVTNNAVTNLQVTNVTNNIAGGGNTGNTGNVSTAGGTPGVLAKFTGPQTMGNSMVSENTVGITVGGNVNLTSPAASSQEITAFTPAATPTVDSYIPDTAAQDLGVKFKTDYNGIVKGIRFYKGPTNTGTHIGSLWTSGGAKLATATFTSETASGWQEVRFATPVAIAADTTYVASYHTDVGQYAVDQNYFAPSGVDNGPLHLMQDGVDGGNGVFRTGISDIFPTQTSRGSNYWVDVIYTASQTPAQYQIDGAQLSSLNLANNSDIAKRSSSQVFSGLNTFRSVIPSTSAFSIQATDTTPLFRADTSGLEILIGNTNGDDNPVLLVLANKNGTDDPPNGSQGAIYYNRGLGSFRCFYEGYWQNCADLDVRHSFTQYDEFMGGQTSSLAGGGAIGSLGWDALAIGAHGSLLYNPATPTPIAGRPGVLQLRTPAVINQGSTLLLGNAAGGSMLINTDNDVKTAVAVGATSGQVLRIGLHSQTTGTVEPVSGVWWEADPSLSVNWRFCYGDGTVATCTPSAEPIVANSWVTLRIRVVSIGPSTSSVAFIFNNTPYSADNVTVDTTNRVSPALSCYATTAAARDCYWDYFQLTGTSSPLR